MHSKFWTTILFLIISNCFMIIAWYGHLKFKDISFFQKFGLISIILISWGLAFFEYLFQVPANKFGFREHGGPFSLIELKVMQEVINLVLFGIFAVVVFRTEVFRWNHLVAFIFILLAVYFAFKK